jgi:hypothetical protein
MILKKLHADVEENLCCEGCNKRTFACFIPRGETEGISLCIECLETIVQELREDLKQRTKHNSRIYSKHKGWMP